MPIKEIKCAHCGKVYEDFGCKGPMVVQKCECGSDHFVRIPSKVAVHFKGEGWTTPTHEDK